VQQADSISTSLVNKQQKWEGVLSEFEKTSIILLEAFKDITTNPADDSEQLKHRFISSVQFVWEQMNAIVPLQQPSAPSASEYSQMLINLAGMLQQKQLAIVQPKNN